MTPVDRGAEHGAGGDTGGGEGDEPTLLGEILSLPPRMASRTIGQIQASQKLWSLLRCQGDATRDGDLLTSADEGSSMSEPVDVLAVLGSDGADFGGRAATDHAAATAEDAPGVAERQLASSEAVPDVGDLVIPGYDSLAASQVVPRLTTLQPAELSAIGAYEEAHRGRRTILNRVRQLLGSADDDH